MTGGRIIVAGCGRMGLPMARALRAAGFAAAPYQTAVPSFGVWGWHLASIDGRSASQLADAVREVRSLPVRTDHVTPALLRGAFDFGRGELELPPDLRPNTVMQPVLVQYHRRAWRR